MTVVLGYCQAGRKKTERSNVPKNVIIPSASTPGQRLTAPYLYNTQSGLSPREVPFRSIDLLGEVALSPYQT